LAGWAAWSRFFSVNEQLSSVKRGKKGEGIANPRLYAPSKPYGFCQQVLAPTPCALGR
jgi:hypothetical protein